MELKTLKNLDVEGKTVFLRSDLNSDVVEGRVLKGERIRESIKTIEALRGKGARIIILAHQGNHGKNNFLGLEQHARLLGRHVSFVGDVVGAKAISAIKGMKNKDVILLDNVRKVEDEFFPKKKGNLLKKNLLPLCEVYINDAFSVSHRDHFSLVGFSKVKEKGIGLLFEKEIRALEKIDMNGCLYVLGGAKPQTDIKLLGRKNRVIVCGLFGQVCLVSEGFNFGYQNDFLKKATLVKGGYSKFLKKLKGKLKGVEMPIDFAVDYNGKRKEYLLSEFPVKYEIEDIGEGTMGKYCEMIRNADAVYMKGPAGFAEEKKFSKGTVALLKATSECTGFSLVGGGQLSEVISKSRINRKKFGHVSLSGGATLAYVAGERLVGLKALGYY